MRGARQVVFPARRRASLELWLYRLGLPLAAIVWWASTHPYEAERLYWTPGWRETLMVSPILYALYQIGRRRPPWRCGLGWLASGLLATLLLMPKLAVPRVCGCYGPCCGSSCISNLKQIALACLEYAGDHEQRLPPVERPWTEALTPYLKRAEVLHCSRDEQPLSYALNPYLRGRKLSDLPVLPTYVVLAYESDGVGLVARHNDGYNIAFADGHVKWFKAGAAPGIWNPWEPEP